MTHGIFATLFYIPFYNIFIFILNILPSHNVGLAIILVTLIVRLVLFPLARQSIKTQLLMKRIEPELQKIRKSGKDQQEQAKMTMQVYRDNDINPFAGILLLLIQLPILIGLYRVIHSNLPTIDTSILYSFVHAPLSSMVSMSFLGISLLKGSFILALLSVITQFIQLQLALPKPTKAAPSDKPNFQTDLANTMNTQMKYVFPIILFPISYISSVIALYFITGNVFMIFQEIFVRRRMEKKLHSKI